MSQPQQPDQREQQLIVALVAYQSATAALRLRLAEVVTRLWRQLGSYRKADIQRFVGDVVPIVAGAQQHMSALTAANLARQRQISLGDHGKPVAVDVRKVTGAAARNGADPREVYERPFHLVWRQLADLPREPGAIDQAILAGQDRALDLASTDLQLTKQRTALQVVRGDDKVVGYRRVLEGAHSCGLCVVAATQRYHRDQLMPIHPACDCSVAPIYGVVDPSRIIEAKANVDGRLVSIADLPDVHDRIEQRFGRSSPSARIIPGARDSHGRLLQYRDVLIAHEHGELGPILAVRGADHRTLDELQSLHAS